MDIFIADLDEDGAGVGEEVPSEDESVAEVGEVGVDAIAPGVAEGFDLLGFAGDVIGLAVLDVAGGGGPLEVGVELDAVGWIEVEALDFPAQAFALGEGGHDLEAIAQDHAVLPMTLVAVEIGGFRVFGQAVEIREEIRRVLAGIDGIGFFPDFRLAQEIVDECLGMDFFLDEERRCLDFERGGGFPPPDELGIEIAVALFCFRGHSRGAARVFQRDGSLDVIADDLLHFCGRDVSTRCFRVGVGGDFFWFRGGFLFCRHGVEWLVISDQWRLGFGGKRIEPLRR